MGAPCRRAHAVGMQDHTSMNVLAAEAAMSITHLGTPREVIVLLIYYLHAWCNPSAFWHTSMAIRMAWLPACNSWPRHTLSSSVFQNRTSWCTRCSSCTGAKCTLDLSVHFLWVMNPVTHLFSACTNAEQPHNAASSDRKTCQIVIEESASCRG